MIQHDSTSQTDTSTRPLLSLTHLTWQRQVQLYSTFSADQLRAFYRLRRQWLREQNELQARVERGREFARYLVETGRLSG